MNRKEEYELIREKYPDYPMELVLHCDLHRRGVTYTDAALTKLQDPYYELTPNVLFQFAQTDRMKGFELPFHLYLNDGTLVMARYSPPETQPYTVDLIDGKFWVCHDDEPLVECNFPRQPDFYDKKTRSGMPMKGIAMSKGIDNVLYCPLHHCHYWNDGSQCKYCDIVYNYKFQMKMGRTFKVRTSPEDMYDVTSEVLKQKGGKWRHLLVTGGSNPGSDSSYDKEFAYYKGILTAMRDAFVDSGKFRQGDRLPIHVELTPLKPEQFQELYDLGISSWGCNIEVWNEEKFPLVCPGKSKHMGRKEWLDRSVKAVEIFGRGNVTTTMVVGVEMAPPPYGLGADGDIDTAVNDTLKGAEFFLENGICVQLLPWCIAPGTDFYKMGATQPPLEFYIKLQRGMLPLIKDVGKGLVAYQRCYKDNSADLVQPWTRLLG